ncbi:hypothetical protein MLD38_030253 [Melastoma candidum]|uniref:Uncharacterized protein n=1 Tax=Melastoma candidum TaxID=119954 RepID=A0ACB9MMZ4_9MYRT|nr:hypothetical protein MLD38_030253 [Melastoma candidum]
MQGDIFPSMGNGAQVDGKILQNFQKSFVQVQDILDQNKLLINEINQNHESRIADNLSRNVGLIRELNNNIRRVVDLYADLSSSFTRSMEASSEGESKSDSKSHQKRIRSGCSRAHERNCSRSGECCQCIHPDRKKETSAVELSSLPAQTSSQVLLGCSLYAIVSTSILHQGSTEIESVVATVDSNGFRCQPPHESADTGQRSSSTEEMDKLVDLKDKWRNLLKASYAPAPADIRMNARKPTSTPIPESILLRVRQLAEMNAQTPPPILKSRKL